jgi:hypothetical protein
MSYNQVLGHKGKSEDRVARNVAEEMSVSENYETKIADI